MRGNFVTSPEITMKPGGGAKTYVQNVDKDRMAEDRINGRVCRPDSCDVLYHTLRCSRNTFFI